MIHPAKRQPSAALFIRERLEVVPVEFAYGPVAEHRNHTLVHSVDIDGSPRTLPLPFLKRVVEAFDELPKTHVCRQVTLADPEFGQDFIHRCHGFGLAYA